MAENLKLGDCKILDLSARAIVQGHAKPHSLQELPKLYEAIKADISTGEERKLSIFVSILEPDSVCALRILQGILINDGLHYSIFPVHSWTQIKDIFSSQLNSGEDLKNVVFINCGGTEDVTQLFQSKETTRLLVIDSRRPIHHNLISDPQEKLVAIVEEGDLDPRPNAAIPPPDGASDVEDSADEQDSPEVDSGGSIQGKRRREVAGAGGRTGLTNKEARRQRKKAVRQKRKEYYELGAYYGKPSTFALLSLAQCLQQADRHSLWLAAIALTDQLIHQRIGLEKYRQYCEDLNTEIQAGPAEEQQVKIQVEGNDGELSTATAKNPITRITTGKDFKFALLRHWTLYDAMLYSPHVAVRLQTWADKGRRRLEELLAKMGFRIKDCKLDFSEMKLQVHQLLEAKLDEYAHTAQLSDLVFPSYYLHWGYRIPLSAADAVHAISALLESHVTRPKEELSPSDAFWRAWKALNPGNVDDIRHGLELAKQLQKAILTDGGLIISRKVAQGRNHFCYIDLSHTELSNKCLFSQPLALLKLGVFLRDQRVWSQPHKAGDTLVIIGPAAENKSCLVVSVGKRPTINSIEGNPFPAIFQKAADAAGCTIEYDGFDSCVGQVTAEHAEKLVNEIGLATN